MYALLFIVLLIFVIMITHIKKPLDLPAAELTCWWSENDTNNCKAKYKKVCEKYGGVFIHRLGYPWCWSA